MQLVIFDLTGTVVWDNGGTGRCMTEALQAVGVSVTSEQVENVAGFSKPSAIRRLLAEVTGTRPTEDLVAAVHGGFVERMIALYRSGHGIEEMPGATAVLRRLKARGIRVALDTGCSRVIVDAVLDRLGWRAPDLIDATVASDEVASGRPSADLILEAMRRTGVADVSATAKVGDTPADLLEGMAAGCGWVVGVAHGDRARAQLALHPHTHLIAGLGELPGVLGVESAPRVASAVA